MPINLANSALSKIYLGNTEILKAYVGALQVYYLNSIFLLLDTYPATLAYSLRKLRTAYTGSAIRVRRSSDNAEQDIGFVDGELDTTELQRFTGINILKYSENFASTNWISAGQVTANQAANPLDGAMTADYVNFTSTLSNQDVYQSFLTSQNLTGRTFTASIWLKGTAGQTVNLRLDFNGGAGTYSTITLTDDWVRYSITHTYPAVTNIPIFRFGARNLNTPEGTAKQFYAYGALITETATVEDYARTLAVARPIADNAFVTTWYDQSGNGNNATQSTQTNQPKIYDSVTGLITENGKPSILFDGVNDGMVTATINLTGVFTNFLVVTQKTYTSGDAFYDGDSANTMCLRQDPVSPQILMRLAGFLTPTVSLPLNNQGLIYSLFDPTNSAIALNSGSAATASLGSASASVLNIGRNGVGTAAVNASFQELIIYNSNQTANRTAIETDINTHYTIY